MKVTGSATLIGNGLARYNSLCCIKHLFDAMTDAPSFYSFGNGSGQETVADLTDGTDRGG